MRKHRRHHRRHFLNPGGLKGLLAAPKQMVSGSFVIEAVSVAAGFVLPGMALAYVPANFRGPQKWKYYMSKVGVIAATSFVAGYVSKKARRLVLLGGGVSILLDIWTDFVSMRGAAAPAGTRAFYGNPGMPGVSGVDAYYGTPGVGDNDLSDTGWTDDDMA